MLGVDKVIEKLNTMISGGSLTELEVTQLSKVIDTLEKRGVSSVLSAIYLPNVVENKGRFFWLETEQQYVYSNGVNWRANNLLKYYPNLYAWGGNTQGQLGDDTTSARSSPVFVVGDITDWVFVAPGFRSTHASAIRANGTMWAWGYNGSGRLGDGTTSNRSSPVSIVGGFTDWIQASVGQGHSLGLRANGTLWSWGLNAQGQLGHGTTSSRSSPVSVIGGFTDWTSVIGGSTHSLGLRANGTMWAWGNNSFGQLGDGTNTNKSSPVSVVGGFTDWTQISAGADFSLAIRANGTMWAWGYNGSGRLGDGTTSVRSSPVSVVGGFTDWIQVSVGYRHSLGLRANGTLWAWGNNQLGQLGHGTTSSRSSPVSVIGGFTDWISVSAGRLHSLGLRTNGTMWAWGWGADGRLGDGTTSNRSSPVSVIGGFTDWIFISASDIHNFGIRTV